MFVSIVVIVCVIVVVIVCVIVVSVLLHFTQTGKVYKLFVTNLPLLFYIILTIKMNPLNPLLHFHLMVLGEHPHPNIPRSNIEPQ